MKALLELNQTQDEFRLPLERLDRLLQITNKKFNENVVQQQSHNQSIDIETNVSNAITEGLFINATKYDHSNDDNNLFSNSSLITSVLIGLVCLFILIFRKRQRMNRRSKAL